MGSQGESQKEELRGAQRPPHATPIPQYAQVGLWPKKAEGLVWEFTVLSGRTGRWVWVSHFPARVTSFPSDHCWPEGSNGIPGRTSDHSPVIQTYSQGCKLQLSLSTGRVLKSQCMPWTSSPLPSSTHSTLRYLEPSPQVLVHCQRQTKQVLVWEKNRVIIISCCYYI